ncbi:DUF1571 domain-containing protein [Candidatus Laterigemmans baculatus]|uniref:DUF1571 domain-containing protein n=1 Tax=Candidatus Laterigemmans baculatus TaxID=2770505 RepID=UPI0013DBDEB0|nr:DUF1571 domain-containing protein [Candidatus Laterigemmans baculatus]
MNSDSPREVDPVLNHHPSPDSLGQLDSEEAFAAVGRRRRYVWWGCLVVAIAGVIWFTARPNSSGSPSSVPVAVEEGDDSSAGATLDDAVQIAREGLERMDRELVDYVGRMTKRERIDGELGEVVEMEFKIRTRRPAVPGANGQPEVPPVPMAVYLHFLSPSSTAGREVIWVEDKNEGNLIAHEGGFANLLRVSLDPAGFLAMRGNLHPVTEIGFKNLVRQLLERSELVRQTGGAEVTFVEDYEVGERPCLLIQVRPRATAVGSTEAGAAGAAGPAGVDFWLAEIAIDRERGVPLRYAAYGPPEGEGEQPPLLEEYVYYDVQLNVGLTDADFDPDNPAYNYP